MALRKEKLKLTYSFLAPPEVYVLILPGFGLVSHIITQEIGKIQSFRTLAIIYAILTIWGIRVCIFIYSGGVLPELYYQILLSALYYSAPAMW